VVVAARKAHGFLRAHGRNWNDVIVLSNKMIKEDLLFIQSKLYALNAEDYRTFSQIKQKFSECGDLEIPDLRRIDYFKSLLENYDPSAVPF
jgi:hypothetical protein